MTAKDSKRRSLGRGLDALLGTASDATSAIGMAADATVRGTQTLPIELIRPSRFQPRKTFDPEEMEALAQSVRENGILQPILVRPDPDKSDLYEIIAGERRWRAAQTARLHEIPVVVRALGDVEAFQIALVENLQRQDLTPLEEADGYRRLVEEFDHTQDVLARAVGKSRSHVANTMRLLGLPAEVKALLERGALTAGHARALLGARDPVGLAQQVVLRGLTVRQTEGLIRARRDGARGTAPRPAAPPKSADTVALEQELGAALGLAVTIAERGDGGDVVIRYRTLEQLDDIVERLTTGPGV